MADFVAQKWAPFLVLPRAQPLRAPGSWFASSQVPCRSHPMSDRGGKDRTHTAQLQRMRRAQVRRVDYTPSAHAWAVIETRRTQERPGSVAAANSAVINAIVTEWGAKHGHTQPRPPELMRPSQARAGAFDSDTPAGNCCQLHARAYESDGPHGNGAALRPRAYDSGPGPRDPERPAHARTTAARKPLRPQERVVCGARRHRDGQPCQAKSEPGKRRCRFHGGRSTGPCTAAGKARALANLRQYRAKSAE